MDAVRPRRNATKYLQLRLSVVCIKSQDAATGWEERKARETQTIFSGVGSDKGDVVALLIPFGSRSTATSRPSSRPTSTTWWSWTRREPVTRAASSFARKIAQRKATCAIRSAETLNDTRTACSPDDDVRTAHCEFAARARTVLRNADIARAVGGHETTNAVGQPSGQSIPVLSACSISSSTCGLLPSRTDNLRMVARPAVHSIPASAVRSGIAARSTPPVITNKGYCGRDSEFTLMPRGVRAAQAQGMITRAGLAS